MKSGNRIVYRVTTRVATRRLGVPVIGDFWGFTILVLKKIGDPVDMDAGIFTGALSLLPLDFLRQCESQTERDQKNAHVSDGTGEDLKLLEIVDRERSVLDRDIWRDTVKAATDLNGLK